MPGEALDRLARALAEPMPRRRALRVLGTTIVAVAAPALGTRSARAATVVRPKCGRDRRVCREFTADEYCCPPPSWQYFCGTKKDQCLNMCSGPRSFPCTALIAHPESGINGVCCDRKYHSRCQPVGSKEPRCCYGNPVTCEPIDEAECMKKGSPSAPPLWAPAEPWKPSCEPCLGKVCENEKLRIDDPQRWVCCLPPATCSKKGVCRCKNGGHKTNCYSGEPHIFGSGSPGEHTTIGQKCCPENAPNCCGTTCCKALGCCGTKCCPIATSLCAWSGGQEVCCPKERVTSFGGSDISICCPAGTVAKPSTDGCRPKGSLD